MNVTREFLLANGISAEVLDAAIARSTPAPGDLADRPAKPAALAGEPRLVAATCGPGWWECLISGWKPVSDNLRARGVAGWSRGKKHDRKILSELVVGDAGVPLASGPRKISLVVEKPNRRGVTDGSNLLKSFHDACNKCGLIIDDDYLNLDYDPPRIIVNLELTEVRSTVRIDDQS